MLKAKSPPSPKKTPPLSKGVPVPPKKISQYNGMKISVVYFIFAPHDHPWEGLVKSQLNDIINAGLVDVADIYVAISSVSGTLLIEVERFVQKSLPSAQIITSLGNYFEYLGLKQVWDLGQKSKVDPNRHVILYFHTKGIVNHSFLNCDHKLTNTVIKPWRLIVDRFAGNPVLNKAGYACADPGWVWYNFWWARASYIKRLVKPVKTQRRYYYEEWLGRLQPPNVPIKADDDSDSDSDSNSNEEIGVFISNPDGWSLVSKNDTQALGMTYPPNGL